MPGLGCRVEARGYEAISRCQCHRAHDENGEVVLWGSDYVGYRDGSLGCGIADGYAHVRHPGFEGKTLIDVAAVSGENVLTAKNALCECERGVDEIDYDKDYRCKVEPIYEHWRLWRIS